MYNSVCPVAFIQKAAIQALEGPQDFMKDIVKEYDERRRFICGELRQMEGVQFTEPTGAFYIFPRIRGVVNSEEFCKELLIKAKVAAVPGSAFGKSGEGHIRISYATSMERLQAGLNSLAGFLRVKPL